MSCENLSVFHNPPPLQVSPITICGSPMRRVMSPTILKRWWFYPRLKKTGLKIRIWDIESFSIRLIITLYKDVPFLRNNKKNVGTSCWKNQFFDIVHKKLVSLFVELLSYLGKMILTSSEKTRINLYKYIKLGF